MFLKKHYYLNKYKKIICDQLCFASDAQQKERVKKNKSKLRFNDFI